MGSVRDGLCIVEEPLGTTANRASPPHATSYYSRLLFVGKTGVSVSCCTRIYHLATPNSGIFSLRGGEIAPSSLDREHEKIFQHYCMHELSVGIYLYANVKRTSRLVRKY